MPYLIEKMSLDKVDGWGLHPTVPSRRVSDDVREKTDHVEWWGSCFSDPGPDYNLFKFIDKHGVILAVVREEGF